MPVPKRMPRSELTVGELAARSGLPVSTLHFYEAKGLIQSRRTAGNQRRYPRQVLRRVAVLGGAGDSAFEAVRRSGADVYVTADLRHHPALEAREEARATARAGGAERWTYAASKPDEVLREVVLAFAPGGPLTRGAGPRGCGRGCRARNVRGGGGLVRAAWRNAAALASVPERASGGLSARPDRDPSDRMGAAQPVRHDGDEADDILWRDESTGRNQIWLSGDHTKQKAVSRVANKAWRVVGF